MRTLIVVALAAVASVYSAVIEWLVWFHFAFSGRPALSSAADILSLVVLALVAMTPLPVWLYCWGKAKAVLRGEHPRI